MEVDDIEPPGRRARTRRASLTAARSCDAPLRGSHEDAADAHAIFFASRRQPRIRGRREDRKRDAVGERSHDRPRLEAASAQLRDSRRPSPSAREVFTRTGTRIVAEGRGGPADVVRFATSRCDAEERDGPPASCVKRV